MLIRFIVNNFLSFGDEIDFNMIAGNFKTHKDHVYNLKKLNVLRAAAVYGANGAGKSNLIKAIEFLRDIVESGEIYKSSNDKKFKLGEKKNIKPISFEIEISIKGKVYSYGVVIDNQLIIEEWLYESGIDKEDRLLFERRLSKSNRSIVKVAEKYQQTQKQKLLIEVIEERLLKNNQLFLSKTKELGIAEITAVRNAIKNKIIIIYPDSKFQNFVSHLTLSPGFKEFANDLLNNLDTGIHELNIENLDIHKFFGEDDESTKNEIIDELEKGHEIIYNTANESVLIIKENNKYIVKKVVASHLNQIGEKVEFELSELSDGTQRLLDFVPAFEGILNDELTFIIDEIDQSLHPTVLKALIQKIMASKTAKGQLIFTTHESNLLDLEIFRQDEIWFVEKNNQKGTSQVYSLSDFKPRYDLDIRKGYLKGRFGAIPFLAHLDDLKWEK